MLEKALTVVPREKSKTVKTATVLSFYKEQKQRAFYSDEVIIEAIGIALAYDCALPVERVGSIESYFRSLNGDAVAVAMELNETVVIDFRKLMARILFYYKLRYETAYSLNSFIINVRAGSYKVGSEDASDVLNLANQLREAYYGDN